MKYWVLAAAVVALLVACGDPELVEPVVDPGRSSFTVDRDTAQVAADVVTATVVLRDNNGTPVIGVSPLLIASGAGNTLTQPGVTNANGEASGTWSATLAESKTITATLDDGTSIGQDSVEFVAGPPAQLRFSQQPTTAEAGGAIPISVELTDEHGNPTAVSAPPVAIALAVNPTGAVLDGATQQAPAQGVATFADLNIDAVATGYVLRASASGISSADSDPFDVVAGNPSVQYSSLTVTPNVLAADGTSAAAISVSLANQHNIPIAGQTITLTASGTNNILSPAAGSSNASGQFASSWTSTVQGTKTVMATAGSLVLMATATFYGPPCTLRFPGPAFATLEGFATAFVLADIDSDGRPDAITAEPSVMKISVRRGRADGTFAPPISTAVSGEVVWLASGDLDGDGKLDLVAVVSDSSNALVLLGDGTGQFAAPTARSLAAVANSVVLADFTADGKLDLAAALPNANQVVVHPGAGDGTFGAAVATIATYPYPAYLNVADLDGDSRPDLAMSNLNDMSITAFLATGPGTFGPQVRTYTSYQDKLLLADVNHDAIPDAVLPERSGSNLRVRLGNGTGAFPAQSQSLDTDARGAGVTVADFNNDTHPDIVVAHVPEVIVVLGSGNGIFTLGSRYSANAFGGIGGPGGGLAMTDFDNNGNLDLVLVGAAVGTARNLGSAMFALPTVAAPEQVMLTTSADFNGDGVPDLVGHHALASSSMTTLLSTSNGSLTRVTSAVGVSQEADGDASDVNEDGKQDLVVFDGVVARPLLGLGTGAFQTASTISIPYTTNGWLRDVNADGHADMLVTSSSPSQRGVHVKLGTGLGTFGTATFYATAADPIRAITADIDADGDRDLIIGTRAGVEVRRNLGTGSFGFEDIYPATNRPGSIAVGDFNGDGRPDIAYTDTRVVRVLVGQANGAFTARPETYLLTSYPSIEISQMEALDVDGSGTLDLTIASNNGFFVLQGIGNATFTQPINLGFGGASNLTSKMPFVLGDRNADGRPDLTFTNAGGIAMALQATCVP
jgi:hypothetical protein